MSTIKTQGEESINLKELFALFRYRWYWFVISVAVALCVAVGYIVITPPIFTKNASILIKNNDKKGASSSGMESLADMGLFKTNTDVQSEMYVLQSPTLMEEVVQRLKLDYNYSVKYRSVRFVDLYNASPIIVDLDSMELSVVDFRVKLLPDNRIKLSHFVVKEKSLDFEAEGELSQPITTPYGVLKVLPTPIVSEFIDQTIYFSKGVVSSVADEYIRKVTIAAAAEDAPVLFLTCEDVSPQRAQDILNTLISAYNENWIKDKNQITASTSEFIGERLRVIEGELGSVDESISDYKSDNLIPDITAVSQMYLMESSSNTATLASLQNQLSMARYIRSYMNDPASKNQLIPVNTGIENSNVEVQIGQYNTILLQKNNLAANSSEQNPIVADMIQSLASMKEVIVRSVDDYISTLNIQLDNIRMEQKRTNSKIATSPNQAKYLLSVERQQKVKESLYLFLLQKREENELSQTFTAYNTKVIDYPREVWIPTSPKKGVIIIIALVVGLLIPVLILFVLQQFDTLVRDKNDLESLDMSFVGEIPILKGEKKFKISNWRKEKEGSYKTMIVVEHQNRNVINEAFRSLRTNLDFMCPKADKGRVVMTTSLYPGSGKTFTTVNTALSMVMKGARTIIIDVDMRRASLSTVVQSPKKGLSNYLNGSVEDIHSIIVKGIEGTKLDVLPAGKIPPNPTELLLGDRFTDLINQLKLEYDYIFLDCPPATMVSDTSIIGHTADLTLFIIRAGLFDKRALPEIARIHSQGHLRNMALILNGVEVVPGKYGYYGHGYGYGEA